MELTIAYHQIAKRRCKYFYTPHSGKIVFQNGWSWIVVFQATNKCNYMVVKFYNGQYDVVEV